MPYERLFRRTGRVGTYPLTVAEVLDDTMTFLPAALRAVRAFRRSKPWRGTVGERRAKFEQLNRDLAAAYGIAVPRLVFADVEANAFSGDSGYSPAAHTITLRGRLSVVTYLHEFAHARGADERQACRWSINLFRRLFPHSFAHCRQVGHTLVRD
jgi:hypothetical protein